MASVKANSHIGESASNASFTFNLVCAGKNRWHMKQTTSYKLAIICLLSALVISCTDEKGTVNYYFDPVKGNDQNMGLSPDEPLKSLHMLKELSLQPGDSVLLKSGAVFDEHLYVSCAGSENNPIVVGKYGGEARPHVKGDTSHAQSVHVYNSSHFIIRDLEISHPTRDTSGKAYGLRVELYNYGKGEGITVDNLYVHDVNDLEKEGPGGGAAIFITNFRDNGTDSISSHFDGLLVQDCLIENSHSEGISMWGNWVRKNWNPNLNVTIRNNVIDGITGHGIVPVACDGPLVEYNVMRNTPRLSVDLDGVDGIWPWSCDNSVVQYNIVSDIKSQWDAYGFDADYNCLNSLFQYNLSYNNKGGFLLVCNPGGWSKDWSVGNVGSVIKYNVSINDGLRNYIGKNSSGYFSPVIHCTGSIKNTVIAKNLIYVPEKSEPQIDKTILHLNNWGEQNFPDSTFFRNNFIYAAEPNVAVKAENSTHHYFSNNQFVGDLIIPADGFIRRDGEFNKTLWYDTEDENWNKLVEFLKDKTIPFEGKQTPVLEIIGYN